MARSYRLLLGGLGENPDRQGLIKTPERAAKAMLFFTKGYDQSLEGKINAKLFLVFFNEIIGISVLLSLSLHIIVEQEVTSRTNYRCWYTHVCMCVHILLTGSSHFMPNH